MNSDFFDRLNNWIRNTESSIVNFLSSFAPWLAPIIPAYMTYSHASGVLEFPIAVAVPAALVVEILGFSAVSTFLAFWFYNRRNVAGTKRAPIEVVIIAFVFYLALIVVSNVLLDATKGTEWSGWAVVAVRALYTLQTIPAALIVAVRTQHRELLSEIAKEKLEKLSSKQVELSKNVPEDDGKNLESSKKVPDWRRQNFTHEQKQTMAGWTPDQMRSYAMESGFTYKTLSNWRSRSRTELGIIDSESNQIGEN
jgi:hypothetical protein